MEPFSALSVATAAIQFIDFTGKIVSGTWKIYKLDPGHSQEYSDIRTITNSLTGLTADLRSSIGNPDKTLCSDQDKQIEDLGERCFELGEELISVLDRLESQSRHRLWASFKQALATVWNQKQIDSLHKTLESLRRQISIHILVALRYVFI